MAKAPRAGEVKTRLCPPLSLADAAELYRRFLLDKIEQVRSLRTTSLAIAYTPAEARAFFEEVAPGFVLEEGPRLGGRVGDRDRKSTRLNSSHSQISYAVFCL